MHTNDQSLHTQSHLTHNGSCDGYRILPKSDPLKMVCFQQLMLQMIIYYIMLRCISAFVEFCYSPVNDTTYYRYLPKFVGSECY